MIGAVTRRPVAMAIPAVLAREQSIEHIHRRNFDSLPYLPRERLLGSIDRILGLDLYITARR